MTDSDNVFHLLLTHQKETGSDVKELLSKTQQISEQVARGEEKTDAILLRLETAESDISDLQEWKDEHAGSVKWATGWIAGVVAILSAIGGWLANNAGFIHFGGK